MKALALLLALALPVVAQDPIVPETPALSPDAGDGPAKEALALFNQGRHRDAVEAARPLAEEGDADALFLLGYAAETGQGILASREEALDFYRKAAAKDHQEATYRRALILLNSKDKAERETGRKVLEAASETDPGTAGRILGEAWLRGLPEGKADFEKAAKWWTSASEAGDTTALLLLARLYSGNFGFAEKADAAKALELYQKAADLGEKAAYLPLGSRLLNGDEALRDEAKGREWLAKAIETDQPAAWLAIGDFEETVKEDDKAAYLAYLKGADAEQQDCMLRVAGMLYNGRGVEEDKAAATRWLEKSAELGNAQAHLELANLASAGENPDLLTAYRHLVAAADGGLATAQNELGLLYVSGNLGAADGPAAVAWFTRAAKAGMAAAQNNLATLYERGAGVALNYGSAGELYSLAANQGHAEATTALARMHALGLGTEPDLAKAWALATIAVERGDENAKSLLGELSPRLTPELLTEAKKQLEELKAPKTEEEEDAPEEP
ncbi:tetratricopeptide repeat protein [Haloferula sp. A504]|uniref:tetratricopeptide repeat protein n=1 Tax=Haloferula sp. A504 TaxID=3373601 RepID=UPI0031C84AFA|nr:SEL1-like repeat protein [Verrucomicrobiaceae bacterium E54]